MSNLSWSNWSQESSDPPYPLVCIALFDVFFISRLVIVFPLCIFILSLAFMRWRCQRRSSHADVFTIHLLVLDLIWAAGILLYLLGKHFSGFQLIMVGFYLVNVIYYGETNFNLLTCVECYLAVVRPLAYRALGTQQGVRIRNGVLGAIWSFSFTMSFLTNSFASTIPLICNMAAALVAVSFCSLSVLRVLVRPGPGEGGGAGRRLDQTKRRAFFTVSAVTVVLWVGLSGLLVPLFAAESRQLGFEVGCWMQVSGLWSGLPSSLVLPVLYLHRYGWLPCCKSTEK